MNYLVLIIIFSVLVCILFYGLSKLRVIVPDGEFHVLINKKKGKIKIYENKGTYLFYPHIFELFIFPSNNINCGSIDVQSRNKTGDLVKINCQLQVKIINPVRVINSFEKVSKNQIILKFIEIMEENIRQNKMENSITEDDFENNVSMKFREIGIQVIELKRI